MLPPGQYSIGWQRQGSEVQIGAEHSWAPWPCRAPPTCLSPPLTCPPTWQTRCPATASARGKLFLGSELELDELGITYQAIPPLGLTQQQLVVFSSIIFWFSLGAPCWEAVWGLTVPYWQLEGERRRRRRCPRGARRAHPEVPRVPTTSRNHPMSSTAP